MDNISKGDVEKNNVVVESNICEVSINSPKLRITNKPYVLNAVLGEIVKFNIVVENRGDLDVDNVIISDMLKPELKFLNDTIIIDGIEKPEESIFSGVNIGCLNSGMRKEIAFDVEIISKPQSGVIVNSSIGQYKYKCEGEKLFREGTVVSNENWVNVQVASVKIDKVASKETVSLGDEITYIIDIKNDGTLEVKNLVVREQISDALTLVQDKITIDSQVINNVNLEKGILLGNLNVGEKKTIIYKVKYINTSNSLTIINTTKVNYDYKKFNGLIFEGNEVENQLEINSTISNFKCIYKTEKIYREKCKPCIEGVNSISADIDILEYHLVKTIEGKSNEGQKLTGYKIVLEGLIKEVIEYSSVEDDGLVYAISEDIPFSTFIILPSNFKVGSKITIDYVIEELDFKKRDKNSIYTNICLLFIAKIQPCLGS